jgi:hypothetical protein
MNTSTAKWHFDLNQNIGSTDTLVRYVVGATLIGITMVAPTMAAPLPSASWTVLLSLVAIPIVISAIMRWDPIYALFQKKLTTRSVSNKTPSVEHKPIPTPAATPHLEDRKAA